MKKSSYYVLTLNHKEQIVYIRSYGRDQFTEADAYYKSIEKKELTISGDIDPVLVSAGSFEILKRAYPNYFLDAEEFIRNVEKIIKENS